MDNISCAWRKIRNVIAGSEVPEDPRHADNTVQWVQRLRPDANQALMLAALGHDIDRATPDRVRQKDYPDYDAFKAAHAERSATLLAGIFSECGIGESLSREVCQLVRLHEVGGNADADLLKDADSLSYFDVNLPHYYQREGREESLRRCIWGIRRLSSAARDQVRSIPYDNHSLREIVEEALRAATEQST